MNFLPILPVVFSIFVSLPFTFCSRMFSVCGQDRFVAKIGVFDNVVKYGNIIFVLLDDA